MAVDRWSISDKISICTSREFTNPAKGDHVSHNPLSHFERLESRLLMSSDALPDLGLYVGWDTDYIMRGEALIGYACIDNHGADSASQGTLNFYICWQDDGGKDHRQRLKSQRVNLELQSGGQLDVEVSLSIPQDFASRDYRIESELVSGQVDADPSDNLDQCWITFDEYIDPDSEQESPDIGINVEWDNDYIQQGQTLTGTAYFCNYGGSASGRGTLRTYATWEDDNGVEHRRLLAAQDVSLSLGTDGEKEVAVRFIPPDDLPAGDYKILTTFDSSMKDADPADNCDYGSCFTLDGPILDVGVELRNVQIDGRNVSATVLLVNYGNFGNVGNVAFSIYLTASGEVDGRAVLMTSFVRDVDFGTEYGQVDYEVSLVLPDGVEAGDYYLAATATPAVQADADLQDNVFVSDVVLSVDIEGQPCPAAPPEVGQAAPPAEDEPTHEPAPAMAAEPYIAPVSEPMESASVAMAVVSATGEQVAPAAISELSFTPAVLPPPEESHAETKQEAVRLAEQTSVSRAGLAELAVDLDVLDLLQLPSLEVL